MRVLVLGGYGLVGGEIMRALAAEGYETVGLARDAALGRRLHPQAEWSGVDIATLSSADAWRSHLVGVDAVVNAAGALQDGGRDRLEALQDLAIRACIEAAEASGVAHFIQISAPGATIAASTAFLRTKAAADDALRASTLQWTIFKPGLVISANAYGGTALLRMLAAFSFVVPLVHAEAPVQTVAAKDVARAVVAALRGEIALRAEYDLVEPTPRSLRQTARLFRAWLGFKPARELVVPRWMAALVAALADIAGWFGWRSALRSTSLKAVSEGVVGDPARYVSAGGAAPRSLEATLADLPSTIQERVFARAQLFLPIALITLAAFWILSGAMGLVSLAAAAEHLEAAAGETGARLLVVGGSLVDIAIGAALLFRKTSRRAALASIAVAAFYVVAGTIVEPRLWLDPFGVLLKVFPAMALAAGVALLAEER